MKNVQRDSQGVSVRFLHARLEALGYGPIHAQERAGGQFGLITQLAVVRLQLEHGLAGTGRVDRPTWRLLRTARWAPNYVRLRRATAKAMGSRALRAGSRGPMVKAVREALRLPTSPAGSDTVDIGLLDAVAAALSQDTSALRPQLLQVFNLGWSGQPAVCEALARPGAVPPAALAAVRLPLSLNVRLRKLTEPPPLVSGSPSVSPPPTVTPIRTAPIPLRRAVATPFTLRNEALLTLVGTLNPGPSASDDPAVQLQQGDASDGVLHVQERLDAWGFPLPLLFEAGYFGDLTLDAVKRFQEEKSVLSSGVVTDSTLLALDAAAPCDLPADPQTLPEVQFGGNAPRAAVIRCQRRLFAWGWSPPLLVERGVAGQATSKAIDRFQAAMGFAKNDQDGIVGPMTWGALLEPAWSEHPDAAETPLLSKGAEDELAVKRLQFLLDLRGYRCDVDGIFGKNTQSAVQDAQEDAGLVPTGTVDAATWIALTSEEGLKLPDDLIAAEKEQVTSLLPAATTPPVIREVLLAAISDLGKHEQPAESNEGPEIDELREGEPPEPWCALAVCHWLRKGLGKASMAETPFDALFPAVCQIEAWAKAHGVFVKEPAVGAIMVRNRQGSGSDASSGSGGDCFPGHTGLVYAIEGGTYALLEGNSGGEVAANEGNLLSDGNLHGFVRWWEAMG